MIRTAFLVLPMLGACAMPPLAPVHLACLERMEGHAESLKPAFAALGYRSEVHLRLDEYLADGRGFAKSVSTLGDSSAGGSIRLRPSRLCSDAVLARAVVAHEMAHVALQHRGTPSEGIVVLWDKPPRLESEANELAHAALVRSGDDTGAAKLVACWLGKCDGARLTREGFGRP